MFEQKREGLRLSHIWFLLAMLGGLLGACNLPLGRASIDIETPVPIEEATLPVSGVPTMDPTLATLQLAVYPPETRTGIAELDSIIDAVLAHDATSLRAMTAYTQVGCTQTDGLGGPPKCDDGEAEGTLLEVVPFLGSEGHHQRRVEYEQWIGPDVLGLLAAYRVGPEEYSDEAYPAGEYAIAFLDANGMSDITLQVRGGRVVRFDYGFPGSLQGDLERDAAEILLPLSLNPIPTAVPWSRFDDPQGRFAFVYPPTMSIQAGSTEDSWQLGDRMVFTISATNAYWVGCLEQPLGDCPVVEEDARVEINGHMARRVKGWFGAVGGRIPQEYLTYIFEVQGQHLVFTLYALPLDTENVDMTMTWPLGGMEFDLFERTLATVVLKQ